MQTSRSIALRLLVLPLALQLGALDLAAAQVPAPVRPAPTSTARPAPVSRPAPPARQAAPVASSRFVLTGTIKELMHGVIDPAADALWDAVSYDITAAGVVETVPHTNDEWYAVRRHALLLAESANLLRLPGRRVAPATAIPGMEQEPPGPEDLPPDEIQKLIARDRPRFMRLSQALIDASVLAIKAVDARSVDGLSAAGDQLDRACEACHLEYWYPKGQAPAVPTSVRKKP